MKLTHCHRLEVRDSPIEGFGVFATDFIPAGTVLEEVPFVLFPRYTNVANGFYNFLQLNNFLSDKEKHLENLRQNLGFKEPEKYFFKWHPKVQFDGDSMYTVLPLGFGPVYNSSNTNNNADWVINDRTFTFSAERDIQKDEEIKTFYGYFMAENGATHDCDTVFNFALDPDKEGRIALYALRFGLMTSFKAGVQNPSYVSINNLINLSQDGVRLERIESVSAKGESISYHQFTALTPMSFIYAKLAEFKRHTAPLVKFFFGYEKKDGDGQTLHETILLKK